MKRKFVPHLVTVIAVTLVVLGVSRCVTMDKETESSKDSVEITWDEGLTVGATRLTNDGRPKGRVQISPDGTKLLYTEANKLGGYWQIAYLRDANNPAKTPLVGEIAYSPSWYSDSNRILYISNESGKGRLVRSSITGGGKTYISREPIGEYGDDFPSIRDGLIVFTAYQSNSFQIATIKENGTETTFLGDGRTPSWHPTENKILFIRNEGNTRNPGGDIYEMNVSSGQVTQLYSDSQGLCYTPVYSLDGRRILFTKEAAVRTKANVNSGTTKKREISTETTRTHVFIMNADGTDVSPISSGNASVISPCWGVNGEIFCLVGLPRKPYEIYKLRIRTAAATPPPPEPPSPPAPQNTLSEYYVIIDGERTGPHSFDTLRTLSQGGHLRRDTLVWKTGMAQWVRADSVSELAPVLPPR
jgi:Tol biopolymer transport system component